MVSALIVVDVQNDFCSGGALAVSGGDVVINVMNDWIKLALACNHLIIASRDWHPVDHCSFIDQGGPWPVHCVQDTFGSEFHPSLQLPSDVMVVNKGFNANQEAYSAFSGVIAASDKPLFDVLAEKSVTDVYVGGLATDYCVHATAKDALAAGFRVHLILPGCYGIDKIASNQCIDELVKQGAFCVSSLSDCISWQPI